MATEEAQTIYQLEQQFAQELSCEMRHEKTPCTVQVTHRARDCVKSFFTCANGAKVIRYMQEEGDLCMHCEQGSTDCWQLWLV